ncbi:MAG: OsmC family protein [Ferruginibacter sp.]
MNKQHHYNARIVWTGNSRDGTKNYRSYQRSHQVSVQNKPIIEASSDPSFLGDASKYNPEELFLASLSSCHMLWYLHLCADSGITVVEYVDDATGTMEENENGGRFTEVILHPQVTITDSDKINAANELHHKAHQYCYIANSCNFPVKHLPVCIAQ